MIDDNSLSYIISIRVIWNVPGVNFGKCDVKDLFGFDGNF